MSHSTNQNLHPKERTARIREIVKRTISRRAAGETVSDERLIETHPDLMPELADGLAKLRAIESAQQMVDRGAVNSLHVRCPHCQHSVALLNDSPLLGVSCPACGNRFSLVDEPGPEASSNPGRIGHFTLSKRLGSGAFGTVWQAFDTELDRFVAIKIPRKGHLDVEETEGLIREARAAVQLSHPHIVRVRRSWPR